MWKKWNKTKCSKTVLFLAGCGRAHSLAAAIVHSHPSAVLVPAPEGAFQTLGRLRGFVGLCELWVGRNSPEWRSLPSKSDTERRMILWFTCLNSKIHWEVELGDFHCCTVCSLPALKESSLKGWKGRTETRFYIRIAGRLQEIISSI